MRVWQRVRRWRVVRHFRWLYLYRRNQVYVDGFGWSQPSAEEEEYLERVWRGFEPLVEFNPRWCRRYGWLYLLGSAWREGDLWRCPACEGDLLSDCSSSFDPLRRGYVCTHCRTEVRALDLDVSEANGGGAKT